MSVAGVWSVVVTSFFMISGFGPRVLVECQPQPFDLCDSGTSKSEDLFCPLAGNIQPLFGEQFFRPLSSCSGLKSCWSTVVFSIAEEIIFVVDFSKGFTKVASRPLYPSFAVVLIMTVDCREQVSHPHSAPSFPTPIGTVIKTLKYVRRKIRKNCDHVCSLPLLRQKRDLTTTSIRSKKTVISVVTIRFKGSLLNGCFTSWTHSEL